MIHLFLFNLYYCSYLKNASLLPEERVDLKITISLWFPEDCEIRSPLLETMRIQQNRGDTDYGPMIPEGFEASQ